MLPAIVYWSEVNTHQKLSKLSLSNRTVYQFYSLGALEMNASLIQELSVCWNNGFRKNF